MSIFDHAPQAGAAQERPRAARLAAVSGAAVSAALILGLGIWAYKLAVRDANGVPVVRAMAGPMREAPTDPGGVQVAHQGLEVNEVAALGFAEEAPETVVLAPAPVMLADDDLTPAALRPEPAVLRPAPDAPDATDPIIAALIAAGAGDVAPARPSPALGVPFPPPRPASLMHAVARPTAPGSGGPETPETPAEIAATALPEGSTIAQIGAFDSPEAARAEWVRLAGLHGSVMGGKARMIEQAGGEGAPFFRLRAAGFADLAEARRFCAVLMAGGVDCVPVVIR